MMKPKARNIRNNILRCTTLAFMVSAGFCSCEHEIDFEYPTAETTVIIEGEVTNEDVSVRISHSRVMGDTTKSHFISDAQVWVSDDEGHEEQLEYDQAKNIYRSSTGMAGSAGHTYKMRAIVDGNQYTSSSTMPPKAQVDSVYFRYYEVMNRRVYFVCVKGIDPIPDKRNYYLYRLMRGDEVFRWNTRSGRSNINGIFEYDIVCSTEKDMEKELDDDGKVPLREGDTLSLVMMTIERPSWLYFQSLSTSINTATNPITNIEGGAQGVFMATSVTRPEAIVFNKDKVTGNKD